MVGISVTTSSRIFHSAISCNLVDNLVDASSSVAFEGVSSGDGRTLSGFNLNLKSGPGVSVVDVSGFTEEVSINGSSTLRSTLRPSSSLKKPT